ncbi:hypothetical protein ABFV05_012698 [Capra hircus]
MLLEGLALLLNPNAAGARKQLLSYTHWQGERPQMDFDSKPHSQPRLAWNTSEVLSSGRIYSQAEADLSTEVTFSESCSLSIQSQQDAISFHLLSTYLSL